MYELIQISEHDYYIYCPAKIGVVKVDETKVVFIDGGSDKDAAKKALRTVEANGWQLKAVYLTHSHADHIGGNKFLQDRTNCPIYANGMECSYTNAPILEPAGLFGGRPFKDLKHKFLLAQPSNAQYLSKDVLPDGFEIINLPGHSFDMVGYKTPDGNAFIGDCVSSEETLAKYGICYLWDPEKSIESLEYLKSLEAAYFVPAHAPVCESIDALAQKNIDAIDAVKTRLLELCRTPSSFEDLLCDVFGFYGLAMNAQQYALIGSTVRSYLSSLYETGKLEFEMCDNRMLWKTPTI